MRGEDGFLWLAPDGTRRTTRQAFTIRDGAGSYFLPKGAEVFVPLAAGWPAFVEDQIPEDNAELLMRAAGRVFSMPGQGPRRLRARGGGGAIAAYNAAHMRLDRGADGDRSAALALLERGDALGNAKSRARRDTEHAQAKCRVKKVRSAPSF